MVVSKIYSVLVVASLIRETTKTGKDHMERGSGKAYFEVHSKPISCIISFLFYFIFSIPCEEVNFYEP